MIAIEITQRSPVPPTKFARLVKTSHGIKKFSFLKVSCEDKNVLDYKRLALIISGRRAR